MKSRRSRLLLGFGAAWVLACLLLLLVPRDSPESTPPAVIPVINPPEAPVRPAQALTGQENAKEVLEDYPDAPPDPDFTVFVRAWTQDGLPASGAEVIFNADPGTTPTVSDLEPSPALVLDNAGTGEQRIDSPGRYLAICRMDNLLAVARFQVQRDPVVHLDLMLHMAHPGHGRVVDSLGKGVAEAVVTCFFKGRKVDSTVSSASGEFQFATPLPLDSLVRGEATGFAPSLSGPVTGDQPIVIVLNRGAIVIATVRERQTGQPSRGLALALEGEWGSALPVYNATTDGAGIARFEGVPGGAYNLRSCDPAFALHPLRVPAAIVPGETIHIDAAVENAGSISGKVVDSRNGAGIPNVLVTSSTADFGGQPAFTDQGGQFTLPGIPPGTHSVGLRSIPPYYGQHQEFATTHGQQIIVGPGEAVGGVVFELTGGPYLKGRVIFEDGRPAPGAQVAARQPVPNTPGAVTWMVETVADPEGNFTVFQVPDAPLYFEGSLRGHRSDEVGPVSAAMGAGDPIILTLLPQPTGMLAGQVVDAQGNPVAAHVSAVNLTPPPGTPAIPKYATDSSGRFLFADVPPGDYEFHFGPRTNGLVEMTNSGGNLTLRSGEVVRDVLLALEFSGVSISGTIQSLDGTPARQFMIDVEAIGGSEVYEPFTTVMTDDAGFFEIVNVSEGTYRLRPGGKDGGDWMRSVVAGDQNILIELP